MDVDSIVMDLERYLQTMAENILTMDKANSASHVKAFATLIFSWSYLLSKASEEVNRSSLSKMLEVVVFPCLKRVNKLEAFFNHILLDCGAHSAQTVTEAVSKEVVSAASNRLSSALDPEAIKVSTMSTRSVLSTAALLLQHREVFGPVKAFRSELLHLALNITSSRAERWSIRKMINQTLLPLLIGDDLERYHGLTLFDSSTEKGEEATTTPIHGDGVDLSDHFDAARIALFAHLEAMWAVYKEEHGIESPTGLSRSSEIAGESTVKSVGSMHAADLYTIVCSTYPVFLASEVVSSTALDRLVSEMAFYGLVHQDVLIQKESVFLLRSRLEPTAFANRNSLLPDEFSIEQWSIFLMLIETMDEEMLHLYENNFPHIIKLFLTPSMQPWVKIVLEKGVTHDNMNVRKYVVMTTFDFLVNPHRSLDQVIPKRKRRGKGNKAPKGNKGKGHGKPSTQASPLDLSPEILVEKAVASIPVEFLFGSFFEFLNNGSLYRDIKRRLNPEHMEKDDETGETVLVGDKMSAFFRLYFDMYTHGALDAETRNERASDFVRRMLVATMTKLNNGYPVMYISNVLANLPSVQVIDDTLLSQMYQWVDVTMSSFQNLLKDHIHLEICRALSKHLDLSACSIASVSLLLVALPAEHTVNTFAPLYKRLSGALNSKDEWLSSQLTEWANELLSHQEDGDPSSSVEGKALALSVREARVNAAGFAVCFALLDESNPAKQSILSQLFGVLSRLHTNLYISPNVALTAVALVHELFDSVYRLMDSYVAPALPEHYPSDRLAELSPSLRSEAALFAETHGISFVSFVGSRFDHALEKLLTPSTSGGDFVAALRLLEEHVDACTLLCRFSPTSALAAAFTQLIESKLAEFISLWNDGNPSIPVKLAFLLSLQAVAKCTSMVNERAQNSEDKSEAKLVTIPTSTLVDWIQRALPLPISKVEQLDRVNTGKYVAVCDSFNEWKWGSVSLLTSVLCSRSAHGDETESLHHLYLSVLSSCADWLDSCRSDDAIPILECAYVCVTMAMKHASSPRSLEGSGLTLELIRNLLSSASSPINVGVSRGVALGFASLVCHPSLFPIRELHDQDTNGPVRKQLHIYLKSTIPKVVHHVALLATERWSANPHIALLYVEEVCSLLMHHPKHYGQLTQLVMEKSDEIMKPEKIAFAGAKQYALSPAVKALITRRPDVFISTETLVRLFALTFVESLCLVPEDERSEESQQRRVDTGVFVADLISMIMSRYTSDEVQKDTNFEKRGSAVFNQGVFMWQAMCVLSRSLHHAAYASEKKMGTPGPEYLSSIFKRVWALYESSTSCAMRHEVEIFLVSFLSQYPFPHTTAVLSELRKFSIKPTWAASIIVVLGSVSKNLLSSPELARDGDASSSQIDEIMFDIIECLYPWLTSNYGYVRSFAQYFFVELSKPYYEKELLSKKEETGRSSDINKGWLINSVEFVNNQKDLVKTVRKTRQQFEEYPFLWMCTVEGVFCNATTNDSERFVPKSFVDNARVVIGHALSAIRDSYEDYEVLLDHERGNTKKSSELSPWKKEMLEATAAERANIGPGADEEKGARTDEEEDSQESEQMEFQKKITPLHIILETMDANEAGAEDEQESRDERIVQLSTRTRNELVVVASLVDKIPNLAGLARTCEIFNASKLVVHDLGVRDDVQFQSISVTAEKWLPMEEVHAEDVKAYLSYMKSKGYAIIALEQTSNSVSLPSFDFPTKAVLLLGKEREGTPVDLLNVVDTCVEIPQFGVIRSLNVHVSASVMVWEYTRQQVINGGHTGPSGS